MWQAPLKRARRYLFRGLLAVALIVFALIGLGSVLNPPTTPYMLSESRRLGGVSQEWVALSDVTPTMARAVVAAEDANFCQHWGFDLPAIKKAIADGGNRGASTISQQTVKNVYLWHGRNYTRKAFEALLTPVLEAVWSKERIVEVYLNVAEFDEGVFGVKAAARHYFGVAPDQLSDVQAARLAAILPDPKGRSASRPSDFVRKRTRSILSGAATIGKDGRSACFES
ncbi:monofunctional biosynthetic peptidoglycan transglycosylase [uncultured Roseobacter sp.]|uniref:monofunctional biosynthetic peptidoglycan transglycosylase n=1 Tax=uncultured Roseobacter sp. TaxID=114847 RepID=UPI00260331EA|nr:monofunctional biosynthetic peptidoglycan transglycosylase [uncultured Roseobacter sp.]